MTDIEICSLALGLVGTQGITSFDDDSPEARLSKLLFPAVRRSVIEDRVWSFAKRQYVLAAHADAPLFDWVNKFEIPAEVARVHRVDDGSGDYRISWDVQGRFIFADVDTVNVIAVKDETDTSLYSAGFCLALAARLASKFAIPLKENRQLQADMVALYQQELKDAAGTDGSQGKSERVRADDFSRRR